LGKSSPTTEIKPCSFAKNEEAKEINVPAPPTILSVFPNGVSIASNATLPTVTNFIYKKFHAKIWNFT
jgi:hypothetical protein